MSKVTWSKKEGLDLRWDKTKILREELKEKGRNPEDIPKIKTPQVHRGNGSCKNGDYVRRKPVENVLADPDKFKGRIMQKISRLSSVTDLEKRNIRLRKIEGMLYYLQNNKGSFTEQEADKIVDACMICRERSDPSHHPLQSSVINSPRYEARGCIQNFLIFADPALKRALCRKGFYLNFGPFSAAESLTLMKNFEKFLARHDRSTDREPIWSVLQNDFHTFYQTTGMFLYIGKNLNRASSQLYNRLLSLYHPYATGKSNAKTDEYILTRASELENIGVHNKHKQIGVEINRFHGAVQARYYNLTHKELSLDKSKRENILKLIAGQQMCAINKINASNVDLTKIAMELDVKEEHLLLFWRKEGEKMCARASLPKWRLEDSLALLQAIEDDDEEDENCIDFKGIHDRAFRGKVQNWEHLREHYNRVRRVVPYYMLNDLQSTVAAAMKEIKKKIEERGDREVEDGDEENGVKNDEDDFIE